MILIPSELLLSFRLWLGRKLFGSIGGAFYPAGTRISRRRCIKWPCEAPEVEALHYVAAQTTIPIPKVHNIHHYKGSLGIEMAFVPGTMLAQCWTELSTREKDNIVTQLCDYIRQLRALSPSEPTAVASANGGPCREVRVGEPLFGPFDDIESFHKCLRGGMPLEKAKETFGELVTECHDRSYAIKFTHGDLGMQNILIQNGKIAAIIDWECAGWYPEYWEYTRAHYNRLDMPDFYQILATRMDTYDDELKAERHLWKIFDQPLNQPRR